MQKIQPMIPEVIKAKIEAEYPIPHNDFSLPSYSGGMAISNREGAEYGFTLAMAVEFGDYLRNKCMPQSINQLWILKKDIVGNNRLKEYTTSELYQTFLNQNEGK